MTDRTGLSRGDRNRNARLIKDTDAAAHAERCRFQRADWRNSSAAASAAGSIKPGWS